MPFCWKRLYNIDFWNTNFVPLLKIWKIKLYFQEILELSGIFSKVLSRPKSYPLCKMAHGRPCLGASPATPQLLMSHKLWVIIFPEMPPALQLFAKKCTKILPDSLCSTLFKNPIFAPTTWRKILKNHRSTSNKKREENSTSIWLYIKPDLLFRAKNSNTEKCENFARKIRNTQTSPKIQNNRISGRFDRLQTTSE